MDKREYTEEEKKEIANINSMSQWSMAHLWRFAPAGHPYFDITLPYAEVFENRFKELGGMTPEISKDLGWG